MSSGRLMPAISGGQCTRCQAIAFPAAVASWSRLRLRLLSPDLNRGGFMRESFSI